MRIQKKLSTKSETLSTVFMDSHSVTLVISNSLIPLDLLPLQKLLTLFH